MDTPSQALAKRISKRLIAAQLLTEDAANRLTSKLADGKLKAEDWRLPIEIGTKKEEAK